MSKLIGPAFSSFSPQEFYDYVKNLYKPKEKKETKNASTSKSVTKKRAKKNVENREDAGQQVSDRNELLIISDNPRMLEESSI